MAATTRRLAAAAVGGLLVVGIPAVSSAQLERRPATPAVRAASFAQGTLAGVVQDDRGVPVAGAVVSALGATTTTATTDKDGRFEFSSLAPGPYHIRAHHAGHVAPRAELLRVNSSGRTTAAIAMRRVGAPLILAAGMVGGADDADVVELPAPRERDGEEAESGEVAWRLRHARRSVLKDMTVPVELLADDDTDSLFLPKDFLGRAVGSPARVATSFFTDTPFSGQVNLLTTGSFDAPRELFSPGTLSRNFAFLRLGAPVGSQGAWTVRGAVTQSDISSWIVESAYKTRADSARHRYELGMSYSAQRYEGGNVLTLRDVTDGSRNAGTVYGYDSFVLSPAATLSYGAAYSRYDYLDTRSLISPRVALTISPASQLRLRAALSQRALAPGAEEFLPPGDAGIWLPPQRTFSSLSSRRPFEAERTTHGEVGIERDFGASTVGVRAFRQQVDDQLVTLFGADLPDAPTAKLGHYLVGNVGDVEATGYAAEFRTVVGGRVHGALAYTVANAETTPAAYGLRYLVLLAPSAIRPRNERLHDLSATIEAEVPETATRVVVLYRVGNGFARPAGLTSDDAPAMDARFDVQVRQSLPFMNFSNAQWEMLLAVRNFFRETGSEQSVYDELLVVRPPKRVVGGVTLRF